MIRPIIFSEPMVRELLARRKTQTRRLATSPLRKCEPGDQLYVRETFAEVAEGYLCLTRADYPACVPPQFEKVPPVEGVKWRPSIHMPRRRSRLTLTIREVRFEPLQSISMADAIAEGCPGVLGPNPDFPDEYDPSPTEQYQELWDSLHPALPWTANPDVVALTFTVEQRNIDRA